MRRAAHCQIDHISCALEPLSWRHGGTRDHSPQTAVSGADLASRAGRVIAVALGIYAYRSVTHHDRRAVRHAEKALGTIEDPPLSPEGEQRSERLAQMFGERDGAGHLDAIYVTNTRRTQQTAAPLAARLHLVADRTAVAIASTAARVLTDNVAARS